MWAEIVLAVLVCLFAVGSLAETGGGGEAIRFCGYLAASVAMATVLMLLRVLG